MKKMVCFILAMIYLCCFLTGCETAGLPKMEETEDGDFIYQGEIYQQINDLNPYGLRRDAETPIGWTRSMYGGRIPVRQLGTKTPPTLLIAWGSSLLWMRKGVILPDYDKATISKIVVSSQNGNYEKEHLSPSITLNSIVEVSAPLLSLENSYCFGSIEFFIVEDDSVRICANLYLWDEKMHIGMRLNKDDITEVTYFPIQPDYLEMVQEVYNYNAQHS